MRRENRYINGRGNIEVCLTEPYLDREHGWRTGYAFIEVENPFEGQDPPPENLITAKIIQGHWTLDEYIEDHVQPEQS